MLKRTLLVLIAALSISLSAHAQKSPQPETPGVRATAAYAEVLLRRVEVQADIEAFGQDYTETNPKMLDLKAELASLDGASNRLLTVKPGLLDRLTQALGRMMVRKAALDADLAHVSRSYAKDHPDVRKAQRRAEFFDSAINEILK